MELELELVERRSGLRVFQEETTACSEVQRIDLACVFWVSPALLVSSSHVRALLGGELTRELKGKHRDTWKQEGPCGSSQ